MLDSTKFCIIKHQIPEVEAEKEVERFRQAIEKTKLQMAEIKKRAEKIADKYAVILDTYSSASWMMTFWLMTPSKTLKNIKPMQSGLSPKP